MAAGIMIMGSSGAGKTTLGKMAAERLGFTFVDIDEYIWRKEIYHILLCIPRRKK